MATTVKRKKFSELTKDWSPNRKARVAKQTKDLERVVTLTQLRKAMGLAQAQVAHELGVTQGEISRLEHTPDLYISTLRRFLTAMNGELVLLARFPNRDDAEIQLGELEEATT